jgi:YVTN family beta-propeller protein
VPRRLILLLTLLTAAPSSADECVFVLSAGIDAVTVLDVARQRISGQLPVGRRPTAVAVDAGGATAWVANNEDNSVSVVDLNSGRVTQTIGPIEQPTDIALTPDGASVLVSERRAERVAIIDVATRGISGRIAAGGSGSAGIAVTADGSRAYVANTFSNSVGVLDLVARGNLGTIAAGAYPFDVALSPDETRLYTANVEGGSVSVLDRATGGLVKTIPVGGSPIGVAAHPSGARLYVANAPLGDVTVIDAATNIVLTSVDLPTGETDATAVVISAAGDLAFTVDYSFANVFAVDTATQTLRWFAPAGGLNTAPESLNVFTVPGRCPLSPVPRLTEALDAEAVIVLLERADLLPVNGTLRIDDELIQYDGRDRRIAVLVTARGAGDSTATAHAEGSLALLVGTPGDANCDGPPTAADLSALLLQIPSGDPNPCGADVERDGVVRPNDLPRLINLVFDPL